MNASQFVVEAATEGGLIAHAVAESIVIEADDMDGLRRQINDSLQCHFDEGKAPQRIILC